MMAKRAKLRRRLAAIVAAPMLGGCVDWAGPLLAGGRAVLGLPVHLDTQADGPACDPDVDTFRCGGAQDAGPGRPTLDIAILTQARYRDDDRRVQARSSRPQARLTSGSDEQDANDATRRKFRTNNPTSSCSITGRDAPIVFIEATAARPDRKAHWRSSSTGAGASA